LSAKTNRGGFKFSTSLIIGLLLVPLSAVAAVALVSPDTSTEDTVAAVETTLAEAATTTSTTVAQEIVAPEIATSADLEAACGDDGMALVTKEADATITPLEQAALDSLRAICAGEGMELPGKPAPDAIVQTVAVAAAPASPSSSGSSDDSPTTTTVNGLAAQFEAEYAATVAYINAAIDDGAHGSMIDLAGQLVAEAGSLADSGNYEAGLSKLSEARNAADQADRSTTRHDDDDDDEHEDDEHHGGGDDDHGDD
jgi:hypothetical protein